MDGREAGWFCELSRLHNTSVGNWIFYLVMLDFENLSLYGLQGMDFGDCLSCFDAHLLDRTRLQSWLMFKSLKTEHFWFSIKTTTSTEALQGRFFCQIMFGLIKRHAVNTVLIQGLYTSLTHKLYYSSINANISRLSEYILSKMRNWFL